MNALMTCENGVSRLVSVIVAREKVQQPAGPLVFRGGWESNHPMLALHKGITHISWIN